MQIKIKTEYIELLRKKGSYNILHKCKHLMKFTLILMKIDLKKKIFKNNWLVNDHFSFDLILVMFLYSTLCTDVLGILIVWSACTHVPCSML